MPPVCVKWPAWHFAWALHLSVTVDEFDAVALKKPTAHASHTGCFDAEPATEVNLPDSHFVCALHTSFFVSAAFPVAALARKKPLPQAAHCVSRVDVPAATVHSPCAHVLCDPEHASTSDASLLLSFGADSLNRPLLHVLHCVFKVTVPAPAVHCPASHLACAVHPSVAVDFADTDPLKKPAEHVTHNGCALVLPAFSVYLPGPHFVCRVQVMIPPWYDA